MRVSYICRYHVIKLFQPFGKVVRVQFLFHMTGENRGAPRGFCFLEFSNFEVCWGVGVRVGVDVGVGVGVDVGVGVGGVGGGVSVCLLTTLAHKYSS
jgi:hypothetical protein